MLKNIKIRRKTINEYLKIVVGTAIMAASLQFFLDPNGMVSGGFTGLSIIVKKLSAGGGKGGIPLWVTNLTLNILLIPIVIKIKGWGFVKRTIVGSLSLSFWLAVIPYVELLPEQDLVISAVFGGVGMGAGVGLVFLGKGSTGGTDMCGVVLQHFYPHISAPKLMQAVDIVITLGGVIAFGTHLTLYSLAIVYLTTRVSDRMMEGSTSSKMLYIISDRSAEIAETIMKVLGRGVTGLHGTGMYTNREKTILICVVAPREIAKIKDEVLEVDPKAFVIVNDSREVLGEGFVEMY